MNKKERIARYGVEAYEKLVEQSQAWHDAHPEKVRERNKNWQEVHPEKALANHREEGRKGGKYYAKRRIYQHTGLQGARNSIRRRHSKKWQDFKKVIAPDSQIHHQWVPETSRYTGVALVEADQHQHGIVDVIRILDGEITLLTEKEIREQ